MPTVDGRKDLAGVGLDAHDGVSVLLADPHRSEPGRELLGVEVQRDVQVGVRGPRPDRRSRTRPPSGRAPRRRSAGGPRVGRCLRSAPATSPAAASWSAATSASPAEEAASSDHFPARWRGSGGTSKDVEWWRCSRPPRGGTPASRRCPRPFRSPTAPPRTGWVHRLGRSGPGARRGPRRRRLDSAGRRFRRSVGSVVGSGGRREASLSPQAVRMHGGQGHGGGDRRGGAVAGSIRVITVSLSAEVAGAVAGGRSIGHGATADLQQPRRCCRTATRACARSAYRCGHSGRRRMRIKVLGPVEVERDGDARQRRRPAAAAAARVCSSCTGAARCRPIGSSTRCGPTATRPTARPGRCARTCLASGRCSRRDRSPRGGPATRSTSTTAWPRRRRVRRPARRGRAGDARRRRRALRRRPRRSGAGAPFGEFTDEWWALPESSRLTERRLRAEERRAAALMAIGHHDRAVPELERLVVEHPLRERPVRAADAGPARDRASGRGAAGRPGVPGPARRARPGSTRRRELAELESAIAGRRRASPGARPIGRCAGTRSTAPIGEGAHGRVYEATQPGTDRRVAIKVIRPDLADSTEFVRRFEAEARLVARLEHPHIVPLYDYWREPGRRVPRVPPALRRHGPRLGGQRRAVVARAGLAARRGGRRRADRRLTPPASSTTT